MSARSVDGSRTSSSWMTLVLVAPCDLGTGLGDDKVGAETP